MIISKYSMLLHVEATPSPLRNLSCRFRDVMTKPSSGPKEPEDVMYSRVAQNSSLIFSKSKVPRGPPGDDLARLNAAAVACEEMVKKVEEGSQVC